MMLTCATDSSVLSFISFLVRDFRACLVCRNRRISTGTSLNKAILCLATPTQLIQPRHFYPAYAVLFVRSKSLSCTLLTESKNKTQTQTSIKIFSDSTTPSHPTSTRESTAGR